MELLALLKLLELLELLEKGELLTHSLTDSQLEIRKTLITHSLTDNFKSRDASASKKVHGPTTTLAGIARRGVFVRPGRCSCLQVSKKKTKTGTTFLTACSLYHLHIIALATSHSVFRSPYNTVEGKFKGGQASSVFILKLFSYNSRLERIPSVIRKSDLRLTPVPRDLCAPKKP